MFRATGHNYLLEQAERFLACQLQIMKLNTPMAKLCPKLTSYVDRVEPDVLVQIQLLFFSLCKKRTHILVFEVSLVVGRGT